MKKGTVYVVSRNGLAEDSELSPGTILFYSDGVASTEAATKVACL